MGTVTVTFVLDGITETQATSVKTGLQTALAAAGFSNINVNVTYLAQV